MNEKMDLCVFMLIQLFLNSECFVEKKGFDIEGPRVITPEMRLHNDLLRNGRGASYPNHNTTLTVSFGLTLLSVVDIQASDETIILNANIRQAWKNGDLTWDPDRYHGIKKLNIRPEISWTPDIFSYANIEEDKSYNGLFSTLKTNIILSYDGNCSWLAPATLRFGCTMNFRDFPFDSQVCPLQFGSFTYDNTEVILVPELVDMKSYTESTEWIFVSMGGVQKIMNYPGKGTPFTDVVYTLKVKRKPLYLLMNLVFPNVMFAFLTVMVFILPTNAGERASFVLTILLALSWYMTSNVNTMPNSSEVIPFFSYFLGMVLFGVFFLSICLCYSIACHYAKSNIVKLPNWMRHYILGKLSSIFNIDVRRKQSKWREQLDILRIIQLERENGGYRNDDISMSRDKFEPGKFWSREDVVETSFITDDNSGRLEDLFGKEDLCVINQQLDLILQNFEQSEDAEWLQKEWCLVALILDKLFLYVFFGILATTIFSCVVRLTQID